MKRGEANRVGTHSAGEADAVLRVPDR
jgi:hypothetical protein